MGLFGTIIGGGIGFMFGGPLGAVIGGAIGSNINGEARMSRAGPPRSGGFGSAGFGTAGFGSAGPGAAGARQIRRDALQAQQAFLIALISLAAKVAKADGAVSPQEVRSFDEFLRTSLGMPAEERRIAARVFNQARDSDIPAVEFARQIRDLLGHQPQRMRDLVSLLMGVAMADGKMHAAEDRMIRDIARELGLDERAYQEARAMFDPRANLESVYATLGLTSAAETEDVKKAYRRLAKEYHPDVLANKGLGEDFQKFASEKMGAVNNAYQAIKEARGF